MAGPVDWPVSMQSISDWITRFQIFPKTWTMLYMADSPPFSLDRECVEFPLCHHLLPAVSRSASHEVEAPFHSPLCRHPVGPASGNVFAELSMYELDMSLDCPLWRHPVWPDGGSVFAALSMYELDMSLYAPLCHQILFFSPAVHRTASGEGEMFSLPPCFKLILTLCYYVYGFLRELDLAFGRSPDRDEALPFHGQTRWVKFNDLAPDIHDAMEL